MLLGTALAGLSLKLSAAAQGPLSTRNRPRTHGGRSHAAGPNWQLWEATAAIMNGAPSAQLPGSDPPDALIRWFDETQAIANAEPLPLTNSQLATPEAAIGLVKSICQRFKEMVEDNRLSSLLHDDDGEPRSEKIAQRVFWTIADTYCRANNLGLSPEADQGAGPVDFKFSQGYTLRVNVEVTLSSHPRLQHGLEKQLPAYDAAEQSLHSILLIVRTTASDNSIKNVLKLRQQLVNAKKRVPEIVVIDGRLKPSASHL